MRLAGASRRRAGAPVVAALAVVLAVAGCTSSKAVSGGSPTTLRSSSGSASSPGEPAGQAAYARFYDQQLDWTSCGGSGLQCAKATVPLDWSAPAGATITLALDRYRAKDTDDRIGSLLVNPGGPGGSGVDWVKQAQGAVVSTAVAARYDVVGFDPRGVGASEPVDCLSDSQLDTYLSEDVDNDTAAGLAEHERLAAEFTQGCTADAGALLGHIGTVDAARDLDVLRAALGEQRLDYVGFSYGTLLGATYAGMFPTRVGRLVLDGAVDPKISYSQLALGQAKGLETSLRTYASQCAQRPRCTLSHDTDTAVQQIRDVLAKAAADPLSTGTSRRLTGSLATSGVIAALYTQQYWTALDQGLKLATAGDGSVLLALADVYSDRQGDGTYSSNLLQANIAIDCVDYPMDASASAMAAEEAALEKASPTFGKSQAYGAVQCSDWPDRPTRTPAPIKAAGAAPILVVGNTGDPITPYAWAQSLASQLSSGRLLTWNGQGHASYHRGSTCIDSAVDGYLLRDVLPGKGTVCAS